MLIYESLHYQKKNKTYHSADRAFTYEVDETNIIIVSKPFVNYLRTK